MDCELLSWEASSINIEEGVCRGCVDTSILFYSYGPFCGSALCFYSSRTVPVHPSRIPSRIPADRFQVPGFCTVPLQCPYSALTVPLWFLHSALTISMTGRGGPEVPYLAFLECKGTV